MPSNDSSFPSSLSPNVTLLLQKLKEEPLYTLTENFALTYASTLNPVLDFFALGGALRERTAGDQIQLFGHALHHAPRLAMRCLFYLRDIRGGQGERRTFRTIIHWLGTHYATFLRHYLPWVPIMGRWDDLYALVDTAAEPAMWELIRNQWKQDLAAEHPSLLGKWLKSENTSSKLSRALGARTREALGLSPRVYRKQLASLRCQINVVEQKMCANQWDRVEYERVPSRASLIYRRAFGRHDETRYQAYLEAVKTGEKKIQTGTLFPYDLVRIVRQGEYSPTVELQWANLPNYLPVGEKAIAVCDVSGSMLSNQGLPLDVSLSLGIYFAERNVGPWQNHFITFSAQPSLQTVRGNSLKEKVDLLICAEWEMNTDLQAVFELLLNVAIRQHIPPEEMVDSVYIITDMEFDEATNLENSQSILNFEAINQKYAQAGYPRPRLVFWNVNARNSHAPVTQDAPNVYLVSGCSPSIFSTILSGSFPTPLEFMIAVLSNERYTKLDPPIPVE